MRIKNKLTYELDIDKTIRNASSKCLRIWTNSLYYIPLYELVYYTIIEH
jgi:hypothetical protein